MFFTLSHLSLKTSSKKARSKSRPYHDPDYEPRIQAALAGVNEKKYMSLAATAREDVSVVYFFIFHLLTNSYPALLYYSYWQGKHKTPTISGGSHQAAACHARVDGAICCIGDAIWSSGNTRPYLGSCRPTLIFPFCHRYGRAINATTGTTSKYPHLLWIFHSSISFSQLNKLSQSCKLRTSHIIIPHSYIFSSFQHSNLPQHIVFFYRENLHPDTVFIFTHIA